MKYPTNIYVLNGNNVKTTLQKTTVYHLSCDCPFKQRQNLSAHLKKIVSKFEMK